MTTDEFIDAVRQFSASYSEWRAPFGDDIEGSDLYRFDEGNTDWALDALDLILSFTGVR